MRCCSSESGRDSDLLNGGFRMGLKVVARKGFRRRSVMGLLGLAWNSCRIVGPATWFQAAWQRAVVKGLVVAHRQQALGLMRLQDRFQCLACGVHLPGMVFSRLSLRAATARRAPAKRVLEGALS